MPVYVPAIAGTHCTYPWRDGQAELTWVAGYILGWSPIQVLTRPGVDKLHWCNQQHCQPSQTTHHQWLKMHLLTKYFSYFLDLTIQFLSSGSSRISPYLLTLLWKFPIDRPTGWKPQWCELEWDVNNQEQEQKYIVWVEKQVHVPHKLINAKRMAQTSTNVTTIQYPVLWNTFPWHSKQCWWPTSCTLTVKL